MSSKGIMIVLVLISLGLTMFPLPLLKANDNPYDLNQNFINSIQRITNAFETLINLIQTTTIHIARSIYSLMATIGFLAWMSRYDKRLGRDLIFGSLMIAFFIECIMPMLG